MRLRLWPKSLLNRLVLVIIIAMVLAQAAVAIITQKQRDNLVQDLIEDQALTQTANLANLLRANPASDLAQNLQGYNSPNTCVSISTPPANINRRQTHHPRLSRKLDSLLNEKTPSSSVVLTERLRRGSASCAEVVEGGGYNKHNKFFGRAVLVISYVPLNGAQWLHFKTVVEFPEQSNFSLAFPFAFAAMGVAGTAIWFAYNQTKALRRLADAAERFGRGETVPALPEKGPQEIVSVASAFNTMQERQRNFISDRLKMLAAMGHDLRTPLTALRLKAEFVKDKAARQDLIASIDEMTTITEASLAFTKAEATNEPTHEIDINDLLAELCDEQKDKAYYQKIAPIMFACRPVALKRALRNLIENAVRYGDEAHVELSKVANSISITISDNGPGIPPGQIEEVFKPFTRLENSRNKNTGGIGMGLAIVRGIIQAHGGQVHLSNLEPHGLRVEIVLPLPATAKL